jgi:ubiquinone/menaquinone biosynthesis C-methylase UbiE
MDMELATQFFEDENVVNHYSRATMGVGLWHSEELLFREYFKKSDALLDLGTGAGRIAIGLAEIGYAHILGVDIAKPMIERARLINEQLGFGVSFQVGDATRLTFEDNIFEGAIFGFNGLMMIPRHASRLQAMCEIQRVIRPGGYFIFTTHDRNRRQRVGYWKKERALWDAGLQRSELDDFGDLYEPTELGRYYIHIPDRNEVIADLEETGWQLIRDCMRDEIIVESGQVFDFADECRFWIVRKPA